MAHQAHFYSGPPVGQSSNPGLQYQGGPQYPPPPGQPFQPQQFQGGQQHQPQQSAPQQYQQQQYPPQQFSPPPQQYQPQQYQQQTFSPPPQQFSPPPQQFSPSPQQYSQTPQQFSPPPQQYSQTPQQFSPPPQQFSPAPQQYAPQPNQQGQQFQPQQYAPQQHSQQQQLHPAQQPQVPQGQGGNIVHIYYESWKMDTINLTDASKITTLYTAKTKTFSKPNLTITSSASNSTICTANFHTFSTKIDITIPPQNASLTMAAPGMIKYTYSYKSPAFGGQTLTWKPRSKMDELDMVLLDEQQNAIARFEPANWAMKKAGKMELLSGCEAGPRRDEVVSTALSLMWCRHIQRISLGIAVS